MIPIFIGGADRSGTTMLGSLLQCIPGSCTTPETRFKSELSWNDYPSFLEYKCALAKSYRFKISGLNTSVFDQYEINDEAEFLRAYVFEWAGTPVDYWIDHTPNNLQMIRHLVTLFPCSYFIHIIRDGRAVANSILPLTWGENTAAAAAKGWINKTCYGFAAQSMFPERTMLVRYESLVENPVGEVQRILDFVGVDCCLASADDLVLNHRFVPRSANEHLAVGKLPQLEFVNKWKAELTAVQIRDFEYYAGALLTLLDYKLQNPLPIKASYMHKIQQLVREIVVKKLLNPRRWRRRNRRIEMEMNRPANA